MKNFLLISLLVALAIGGGNHQIMAQEGEVPLLKTGNYLTIGAFHNKQNAIDFKNYVNNLGDYKAEIGYLSNTDFSYVYVKTYDSPKEGYPDVWDLRKNTNFDDTWVFSAMNDGSGIRDHVNARNGYKFYLTVGTFASRTNALSFLSYVRGQGKYDAHIVYSPYTEYFYVYVTTYPTFPSGSPHVYRMRSDTPYDDTWLFSFREDELVPEGIVTAGTDYTSPQTVVAKEIIETDSGTEEVVVVETYENRTIDFEVIKASTEMRSDGKNDTEIIAAHDELTDAEFNVALSYLNPEGSTLSTLQENVAAKGGSPDPRLLAVAEMVAAANKNYPILTDAHEDEMFEFLTEDLGQLITNVDDFVRLVDIAVNMRDFHRELPLDLAKAILEGKFQLTDAVADSVLQANAERIETEVLPPDYIDEEGNYQMFFNTYFTKDNEKVAGAVQIIDPVRLKQISVKESLKTVWIPNPNNQSESIQVIANIFGYKKVQHDFKMSEPFDELSANFLKFQGDVLMVDFPLNRYDVGEIATMFNVYYYKDAAVMRPESQYEIKALLEMLQENPNLKIRIHGHTNGKAPGKIITLSEGNEDYYSLDNTEEGFASSMELSEERAQVIKSYLVSNGIDEDRAEVKGWGGKKPIYDKFDRRALKNVRVEIEILEN